MDIALKWLTLLHNPEDIVEIRSIDPKPVISGYFKADSAAIAKEIARFPNRTFYQTLQMVQPACYARGQHEHLMERPRETTSDNDIAGYQWILVDTDPVRPSGVSASQPEKEAARKVSATVMKKLMAMGFKEPIVADSGNGYHLLFKIHASTDDRQIIADFLSVLDMWFSTNEAKIDTSVFNPARITKLYGTMTHKGANTQERPHRASRIIRMPEHIEETSMTLVRNVADVRRHMVAPLRRILGSEMARHSIWSNSCQSIPYRLSRRSPLAWAQNICSPNALLTAPIATATRRSSHTAMAVLAFTAFTTAAPATTGMNSAKSSTPALTQTAPLPFIRRPTSRSSPFSPERKGCGSGFRCSNRPSANAGFCVHPQL